MRLRFISPDMHGIVDYAAGAGLMVLPFILNLGESSDMALWLSVVVGAAVWLVSALTDYRLALRRTIPFDGHLAIDLGAASLFMAAPFLFHFEGLDAYYYWANATVVYLVVALTASKPTHIEKQIRSYENH